MKTHGEMESMADRAAERGFSPSSKATVVLLHREERFAKVAECSKFFDVRSSGMLHSV